MHNPENTKEKYLKYIGPWFFVSLLLLGIPLILSDKSKAANAFIERNPWILVVCFAPLAIYMAGYLVLTFVVTAQFMFEEYHKLRTRGESPGHALYKIFIFIAIICLLFIIGRCAGGNRFVE